MQATEPLAAENIDCDASGLPNPNAANGRHAYGTDSELSQRCNKTVTTGRFKADENKQTHRGHRQTQVIDYETEKSHVYECFLPAGVEVGDDSGEIMTVELKFDPRRLRPDAAKRYRVTTMAYGETNGDDSGLARRTTNLFSVDISLAKPYMRLKPMLFGAALAVLLVSALVFFLWKSKGFNKMRFFKNQLEEAQNAEKARAN